MFHYARRRRRPTLSVVCGAYRSGPLVASCIGSLREIADEIIIGADERVDESDLGWYGSIADELVTFPFLGPNQHRGWLRSRASGDWILLFDDDEIASQQLIDALPDMLSDRMIAAYRLPMWWVTPDGRAILDDRPWSRDSPTKLVRNDDRLWFPSRKHTGAQTNGATKRVEHGFLHLALAIDDYASRVAKVAKYDSQQFGMLIEGRSMNEAYYLPEFRDTPPRVRTIAPQDQRRVTTALAASGSPPRRRRTVSVRASADDVCRSVPWTPFDEGDAKAHIEVLYTPNTVRTDTTFEVDLAITNLGTRVWPSDPHHQPAVRVSYHWFAEGHLDVWEGRRSLLPHPLRPGERTVLTCLVDAPPARPEAPQTLGFDVLVENDRWFASVATVNIVVTAAPKDQLRAAQLEGCVPISEVLTLRAEMIGADPLAKLMQNTDMTDEPEAPSGSAMSSITGLPVGAWALDRATLQEVVRRYDERRPDFVVEFGSGTSTVLLAALARQYGRTGVCIVSVEQSPEEAERVRHLLAERGLDQFVEIIVAPLTNVAHAGATLRCYDPAIVGHALEDRPPTLVLVDGPSQVSGGERFPTLLMVQPHVRDEAVFLVDDAWRDKELLSAERWTRCPGFQVQGIIPLPKGLLVGTLTGL